MLPDKIPEENLAINLFREQALNNRLQAPLKKSLSKKKFPYGAFISCLLGAIIAAAAMTHFFMSHSHHAKLF